MPDDDNTSSHLWIPPGHIRRNTFDPTGGGKAYTRTDYSSHGQRLKANVERITKVFETKADARFTKEIFVQLKTPSEEAFKDHQFKFKELGFEIVSLSTQDNTAGTAVIERDIFSQLSDRVRQYADSHDHRGRSYFAPLEEIADVPINEKMTSEALVGSDLSAYIITLFSLLSQMEKEAIIRDIAKRIKDNEAHIDHLSNGNVLLVAKILPTTAKEICEQYLSVRSVTLDKNTIITRAITAGSLPNPLLLGTLQTNETVAVFDSGVSPSAGTVQSLVEDTVLNLPPGTTQPELRHGTLVASRVIYGDELENLSTTNKLTPYCKIIDVQVFGIDAQGETIGPSESALITMLDRLVPQFKERGVRIVNLSLGNEDPIGDHEYSQMASQIDFLAREHDVVFVIAAGNIANPAHPFPHHFKELYARVRPPAESLLSLTVGSIAKHAMLGTLSASNQVSPFSCVGPGANGGMKPDLVAHGGNLMTGWSLGPRIAAYGIDVTGLSLAYDCGTSFAAPLLSQACARLFHAYGGASANLVKCLLYHYAEPVLSHAVPSLKARSFFGLGEPNLAHALFGKTSAFAYLYEGKIKDNEIQFIKFHIPDTLAAVNAVSKLRLRITAVFDPPVNADNPIEYCQCRMFLALAKPTSTGSTKIITPTASDSINLYNHSWSPMLHWDKSFSKGYITGAWEVRLRLSTRGRLPPQFEQAYAIIIEIVDDKGQTDCHADLVEQFGKLYAQVELRSAAA